MVPGRHAPGEPEPHLGRLVQVVQSVGDRRERGGTGQDRADRDGKQPGQGIPHPARIARVRDQAHGCQEPSVFTVGDLRRP
jgi:hypothetical protein